MYTESYEWNTHFANRKLGRNDMTFLCWFLPQINLIIKSDLKEEHWDILDTTNPGSKAQS